MNPQEAPAYNHLIIGGNNTADALAHLAIAYELLYGPQPELAEENIQEALALSQDAEGNYNESIRSTPQPAQPSSELTQAQARLFYQLGSLKSLVHEAQKMQNSV